MFCLNYSSSPNALNFLNASFEAICSASFLEEATPTPTISDLIIFFTLYFIIDNSSSIHSKSSSM